MLTVHVMLIANIMPIVRNAVCVMLLVNILMIVMIKTTVGVFLTVHIMPIILC